jgi:hypothetical protein
VYLRSEADRYFFMAVVTVGLASWTRASGISLGLAIFIYTFMRYRFKWQTWISTIGFLPFALHVFYQWLFFGGIHPYLGEENIFFGTKVLNYFARNLEGVIFRFPIKFLFGYDLFIGERGPGNFYRALLTPFGIFKLFMGGIVIVVVWTLFISWLIKQIKSKELFIPYYILSLYVIYQFYICDVCGSPRYLLPLYPFLLLSIFETLKKWGLSKICIFLALFWLFTNIYGMKEYMNTSVILKNPNEIQKNAKLCIIDEKLAPNTFYKLCYNKKIIYTFIPVNNLKIYNDNILIFTRCDHKIENMEVLVQSHFKDHLKGVPPAICIYKNF